MLMDRRIILPLPELKTRIWTYFSESSKFNLGRDLMKYLEILEKIITRHHVGGKVKA